MGARSIFCLAAAASALRFTPDSLANRFSTLEVARAASGVERLAITNPATGGVLTSLPNCGSESARLAIARAESALPSWSSRTAHERCAILRKWHDLIVAHTDDLAEVMTLECGKPLQESRGEVAYGASFVGWYAEEAKRVNGAILPSAVGTRRTMVLKEALGVVGAITPWNFPLAMVTRKAAPALAAGCTMVLKPAELTPLTALALAELAAEAGVPDGALEVVVGLHPAPIGAELCSSPVVRGLTFTGSTAVGKRLLADCAQTVKKVSLELGGHAPFIVAADADIEAAALGALASKFRNNGQTCVCANRFIVHSSVADAFADALVRHVSSLTVGDGIEPGTQLGPLISAAGLEKVEAQVRDAEGKGAKVLAGGKRHEYGGLFYEPTVLFGVDTQMDIWSEETFGPVAPITTFETDEEALTVANDSPYGLAAYVYTSSLKGAFFFSEGLECGIVGVNEGVVATEVAPFGGTKESGLGREGAHDGIEEFLETKYVAMGGL